MKKLLSGVLMLMAILMLTGCPQAQDPEKDFVTLTLDANGGVDADGETQWEMHAPKGAKANLLENEFVREGYIFLGWADDKNATTIKYADKANYTFTDNKTIYAVWEKIRLAGAPVVTLTTANSKPAITWNAITGATKYTIYWNLKNDSATATVATTSDKTYIGTYVTLVNDIYTYTPSFTKGKGLYYYWVKAENEEEVSDFSSVIKINNGNLKAPETFTITQSADTKNTVSITFEDSESDNFDYVVYQNSTNDFATATKATPTSYRLLREVYVNEAGMRYFWITKTEQYKTGYAESEPSEAISINLAGDELKAPTVSSATKASSEITITWTKVDTKNPRYYHIYYYTKDSNPNIADATMVWVDGRETKKRITLSEALTGPFYWWILEADYSFTDCNKASAPETPFVKDFSTN